MTKKLDGRVAIVTGSGMGSAKGIAVSLAREGAKVITNNRKPGSVGMSAWMNKEETESCLTEEDRQLIASLSGDAQTTADQIIKEGGEAIPFFGDPGDFDTAGKIIEAAMNKWGRVDILVNGAAGSGFGSFLTLSKEDWYYQTNAKLNGTFNTMHHALPIMMKQGFGRILNAASDAWIGLPMFAAYSAANGGVVSLTKAVAKEVWGTGITCNAFCPRAISRNHVNFQASMRKLLENAGPEMDAVKKRIEAENNEHQMPENLGPFFVYLSTEDAGFISGSVFTVTSGGRINLYSEFSYTSEIVKRGDPWTVDELMTAVPEQLLKDYVCVADMGSSIENRTDNI